MGIAWELGENKRILMGYWSEQEEFDEIFWEVDKNKRNLVETWWEQKNFDELLLMGTRGICKSSFNI